MKAITAKFISATNTRPSRIAASDLDGNRVIIPFDHDRETHEGPYRKAANALCVKMSWPGELVGGAVKDGYVFVFMSTSGSKPI